MEGASILITGFHEGTCFNLLDFLIAKKVTPYVIVRDFENVHEVYGSFPTAIPIVLDFYHSLESTTAHLTALPTLSCIFNFNDGDDVEKVYRQTFEHFTKTITTSAAFLDTTKICKEMNDALSDGHTLIVNFTTLEVTIASPPSVEDLLLKVSPLIMNMPVATSATIASTRNLKFVLDKLFFRHPENTYLQKAEAKRKKVKRTSSSRNREANPISHLFRKFFASFNPCGGTSSLLKIVHRRSKVAPIMSPEEINKYINSQQNHEIKIAFQTIHQSALNNWIATCEEHFDFNPPELDQRFTVVCQEIKRKGEEGRKLLLDKISKDFERTMQWDHVLGAKTIDRLWSSREKEIELKVQHFCSRKIAEARKMINDEIQENKERTKATFYKEILDEQLMELLRIKETYQKRRELLMLPYTGELKILN